MSAMFHLSIPVANLETAKAFYVDLLGCTLGRAGARRMDINFFGHHVVTHLAEQEANQQVSRFESDGASVSVRHSGAIVAAPSWHEIVERLRAAKIEFSMPPQVIREGTVEEQHIAMIPDGCGNIVELKSISQERVFASTEPT